jgi:hypothetical protein
VLLDCRQSSGDLRNASDHDHHDEMGQVRGIACSDDTLFAGQLVVESWDSG